MRHPQFYVSVKRPILNDEHRSTNFLQCKYFPVSVHLHQMLVFQIDMYITEPQQKTTISIILALYYVTRTPFTNIVINQTST